MRHSSRWLLAVEHRPWPARSASRVQASAGRASVSWPACITATRSPKRHHFVQVVRNHQHRRAGISRGDQLLLHIGDGADVQAPGGLVGDDEFGCLRCGGFTGRRHQSSTEDEFLHVAARERSRRCVRAAAAHVKLAQDAAGVGLRGLAFDPQGF
jgi:hypothetical protein